ncbi:Endothelin-converting enzyme 1, partial [Stegodyphus mimosarum]
GNEIKKWSDYTTASFNENAQCFIKQYNGYRIEFTVGVKDFRFIKIDGNETLDENIADNGGLKAAYLAYQAWTENNPPEPLLPNLNYT